MAPTTSTVHFHIFIHFVLKKSQPALIRLARNVCKTNVDVRIVGHGLRGLHKQQEIWTTWHYVLKSLTRIADAPQVTYGNPTKPNKQRRVPLRAAASVDGDDEHPVGKERDIQAFAITREHAETPWHTLVSEHHWLLAGNQKAKALYEALRTTREDAIPDRILKKVCIFWGAAGTGKTTLAKALLVDGEQVEESQADLDGRIWMQQQSMGHFFGSLKGDSIKPSHSKLIIDEMAKNHPITFTSFKQYCNTGHGSKLVNVKHGCGRMNVEEIVFTSNQDPREWFKADFQKAGESGKNNWEAFRRRLQSDVFDDEGNAVLDEEGNPTKEFNVFNFPDVKPDGQLNRPHHYNDLYLVRDNLELDYPFKMAGAFSEFFQQG